MSMIGEKLRNARLAKGLTTSQAALATHIKVQSIEDMENDDFSRMAAPIYCKGFIKIYAGFLGLDPAPLIEEYVAHNGPAPAPTLGEDAGGIIEHPDRVEAPEEPEPAKETLQKFEWPKMNIFRRISLPREPARIKAMIMDEPMKFALVGLGGLILLVFVISGLVQLLRPRAPDPAGSAKAWDASAIGKKLPAPYVDSDK